MIKTLHIQLQQVFKTPAKPCLSAMIPTMVMPCGQQLYYKQEQDEAILQEFDGLLGYINLLDLKLKNNRIIPLHVTGPDIHLIALLTAQSPIHIKELHTDKIYEIKPLRGRYLYLSAGDYELHIPIGHTSIFNFYFRCSIFRDGNERPFEFLHPLINAHHSGSTNSCCSIDFKAATRTRSYIRHLLNNLKKGKLDNEKHILHEIEQLIKLSSEKIFIEYGQFIASRHQAHMIAEELEKRIKDEGQKFIIKDLSNIFGKSKQYLGRIFKNEYELSIQQYRNNLLIVHVKEQLLLQSNITQTAYHCGFNNVQHFNTFFKSMTGISPGAFLVNQKE